MRYINGAYSTYFNLKRNRAGHLFQGRYQAILIEADEYFQELSRYIHLNPVRAGIVNRSEEYPWTSYNAYIGKKKVPEWLKTDFILGYFDKKASSAGKKYHHFVEDRMGCEYKSPIKETIASTILGSVAFISEIREKYIDKKNDRNVLAKRI